MTRAQKRKTKQCFTYMKLMMIAVMFSVKVKVTEQHRIMSYLMDYIQ